MDFKPEVTAEDYLEIQYLMSLGLLKLPAIEAYLEKLRSNGSILRGDRVLYHCNAYRRLKSIIISRVPSPDRR